RDWFRLVLASQTRDAQAESLAQRAELQRQETLLVQQQDRLLNLRLSEDVDQETFARKHTELRDRLASIKLQLDAVDRSHDETAELATKVFELSQTLRQQWLTADYPEKRRLLEIVFLNSRLDGVTLVPTMRKPFDVLAEGLLLKNSRGDWIRTSDLLNPIQEVWRVNSSENSPQTCARTPPLGSAGRCVRSRLPEVRFLRGWGGPQLARLADSVKGLVSPRPTSRLSPPPPRSAPPFLECSSSLFTNRPALYVLVAGQI